jgi:hypothetical protein
MNSFLLFIKNKNKNINKNKYMSCFNSKDPIEQVMYSNEPTNLNTIVDTCKLVSNVNKYYGTSNKSLIDPDSQYYKDVMDVINDAKIRITNIVKDNKFECTPLIMSDMDDTIWSCYAEAKSAGFCYTPSIFNTFAEKKELPAIFPTLDLLHYCIMIGVVPVFVSGRPANYTQANITSSQLQGISLVPGRDFWGGPFGWNNKSGSDVEGPNGSGVKSMNGVFMHNTDNPSLPASQFKANCRQLMEQNGLPGLGKVKFIAAMGDQWSDSANGYNGGLRIKLPNPLYFLP